MALTRAEAIELFEKGSEGSQTRINFEKEMEKVRAGASSATDPDTDQVEASDDSELPTAVLEETPVSDDAAGKATEPKKEVAETEEAKKTETPAVDPTSVEARLELMERELKHRDLLLGKMQVQFENRDKLARSRASEMGNLKKAPAKQVADLELDTLEPAELPEATPVDEWKKGVTVELAQQAMKDEMLSFASENEDADEYLDRMVVYVEKHREDYYSELSSGNPKAVRRATNLLMHEALVAAKEEAFGAELTAFKANRQKQADELKEKKQGASASGGSSGTASNEKSNAAKKSVKDLSDDDLRNLINANRNG
jgi:hypothetical protein